ncbi:alpha-tocopherol transfer protein-like isoform X1 [Haematobia irritans]|uniref:alpha-tocopherol transfer protein-like isoform X1 n=1 Tax=Haematobia irritans TaxID=7368 RepID=UPI003F50377B
MSQYCFRFEVLKMLQIKPLSAELQNIANVELNEVPSRIFQDLQMLKDWIRTQPHLKARTDDQFLIQFLRGCKYSLEKAKQKLDCYFTLKSKCNNFFSITNVDDYKFRGFHNTRSIFVLPKPIHENGPRIIFIRMNFKTDEFNASHFLQYNTALNEILLVDDPYACIYGILYVVDLSQAKIDHMLLITPTVLKKAVTFYENTLPLRIKGICAINIPTLLLTICEMLVQHLPKKLQNSIYLCGTDTSVLEEQLPRKYFPVEYGGENGSLDQLCQDFNKVWDEYREYFKQNAEYGTDESLRLGKKIDFDDDLGIGGSFRKLDVD